MTEDRAYHHGDLPVELMNAALEHIARDGTEGLSLRALAREVGVSATAPYRHFPTKRCLLAALATRGFGDLNRATRARLASTEKIADRVVQMGVVYVEWAVANPVCYQLMFGSVLGDFSDYDDLRDAAETCYGQVLATIEEAVAAKVLVEAPTHELGGLLWSMVHGMASLVINKMGMAKLAGNSLPYSSLVALANNPEVALRRALAGVLRHPG